MLLLLGPLSTCRSHLPHLQYPIAASVAGLVYIVGRIVFFKGYSTGKADNRRRGGEACRGA